MSDDFEQPSEHTVSEMHSPNLVNRDPRKIGDSTNIPSFGKKERQWKHITIRLIF